MDEDLFFRCDECNYTLPRMERWPGTGTPICIECENHVRGQIGDPAVDAELTPDELGYLSKSLGVSLDSGGNWSHGCKHCVLPVPKGNDRAAYPCLRTGPCHWSEQIRTSWLPSGWTYSGNISFNYNYSTSTSSNSVIYRTKNGWN